MSTQTNRFLVDRAESLIVRCREARLNRFVLELSNALQIDLALTRLAITRNDADSETAARESRRQLEALVELASETLREIQASPIAWKDGEVHAFAATFTPGQIPGLVRRLTAAAYNAQQQVDYAVRLTRKALNPQPVVSIQ